MPSQRNLGPISQQGEFPFRTLRGSWGTWGRSTELRGPVVSGTQSDVKRDMPHIFPMIIRLRYSVIH